MQHLINNSRNADGKEPASQKGNEQQMPIFITKLETASATTFYRLRQGGVTATFNSIDKVMQYLAEFEEPYIAYWNI